MVGPEVWMMARCACWIAGLVLCLTGCQSTAQDRVRDYNTDGLRRQQQGDFAGARQSFQAALELKGDDAGLLYNVGDCSDRLGDVAGAERFYLACLQRQPNHAVCRHALCSLLVRANRRDEAVHMVEDWLAREPKLADPYAEDGWLWHEARDLPRAQARLQQALELEPHNVRALNELGHIYEDQFRLDRALVLYERSLVRDPNQPEVARRVRELRAQGFTHPKPEE
jgi:tetratricopeptide (TPR) repeat protein